MTFATPWGLVALMPAALLVVWIARRGRSSVPESQTSWARRIRIVSVVALSLALAQPALVLPSSEQAVVFLVDASDSVGDGGVDAARRLVQEAVGSAPPDARWSVVLFGSEARVDRSLAPGAAFPPIGTEVDGSATDLGGALEAAGALLPTAGSRRVVLISDLVPTDIDGRGAALALADAGVAIDVVPVPAMAGDDALVESVRMPATAREGDIVTATIEVRSTVAGPAVLRIDPGNQRIPVELVPGDNSFEVEVEATDSGFLPVTAEIEAGFDTRPENDVASGITRVLGPARVALVEGVDGEGDQLAAALAAGGIRVDVLGAVPGPTALLPYDAVIMVNVAEPETDDAEALASFVEDLGRGLVVVGGDQAYGLGDYQDTPLEAVLPVSSNPDDLLRRQPVAQVLVIDTSGSMSTCHCGPGNEGTQGIDKTDISRAGAALAIDAMEASDRIGVLAFSSGYDWVLPLAQKPGEAAVDTALATLTPDGDTEINVALEAALDELTGAPESLKHILLFTDGWDPTDADLVPTARRIADEGVTLSVLGTGEGPGHTLERMAEVGGGRYYAGTDLTAIPEVFVEETLTVARNLATEGSFLPTVIGRNEVTADLTASPPLLGYVLTKAKGTSDVLLEIDQGDPLLATWQRGLGRATAWTSDATSRWSAGWVGWDGYVDFWGGVVRDVLPAGRDTPPEVWVEGGEVRMRVVDDGLADEAAASARVRTPDGTIESVTLTRVSGSVFEGEVVGSGPGAYWVAVTVEDGSGGRRTVSSGAVSSYQPEFAFREPDPTLAADLTATTGGRVEPDPAAVWDEAPVNGRSTTPIWPWLVMLALAGFAADVALRRLSFSGSQVGAGMGSAPSAASPSLGPGPSGTSPGTSGAAVMTEAPVETASDSETLQRLMRRKRR
jgi:uncharacterized membrane protein